MHEDLFTFKSINILYEFEMDPLDLKIWIHELGAITIFFKEGPYVYDNLFRYNTVMLA